MEEGKKKRMERRRIVWSDNLDSIAGAMQWKSDLATKVTYLLLSLQSVGKD